MHSRGPSVVPFTMVFAGDNLVCSSEIETYLLEKSRICFQTVGERGYHSFYQLCCAPADLRAKYKLGGPLDYKYTAQGQAIAIPGVSDADDFTEMTEALTHCGFSDEDKEGIFRAVAGVLHLGNIEFVSNSTDNSSLSDPAVADTVAEMLGVHEVTLKTKLVTRLIKVRREQYEQPLSPKDAVYSRDALAKATYSRMFDFLVARINEGLVAPVEVKNFIGVLDIYGFEFFEVCDPACHHS
jgi:myosin heavy subunit